MCPGHAEHQPGTAAGLSGAPSLRGLPLGFMNIVLPVKYIPCVLKQGGAETKGNNGDGSVRGDHKTAGAKTEQGAGRTA